MNNGSPSHPAGQMSAVPSPHLVYRVVTLAPMYSWMGKYGAFLKPFISLVYA